MSILILFCLAYICFSIIYEMLRIDNYIFGMIFNNKINKTQDSSFENTKKKKKRINVLNFLLLKQNIRIFF